MKKIILFVLLLIPWFASALIFPIDSTFYESLKQPFFAPPSFLFGIVWSIIYFLIAVSLYHIYIKQLNNKQYNLSLILNYITNQLYTFLFFTLKSPFLGFADCLLVFITSINLYLETKSLDTKASKFLIPYLIWNGFATFLSLSIYLMNF